LTPKNILLGLALITVIFGKQNMGKKYFKLLSAVIFIMAFYACNPLNPAQEIPSYITIDTISFEVTDPKQGTSNQKITDAWVYINENLVGAFELPATFPVLAEGNQRLLVVGGIKINGIASSRTAYPFFRGFSQNISLKLKETLLVKPTEQYKPSTNFKYSTDFESGLDLIDLPNASASPQLIVSPLILQTDLNGTACAGFVIDENSKNFSVRQKTDTALFLKTGGTPVFLEFNYKSNHPFSVGLIASYDNSDEAFRIISVNPSQNWNKIYVNLTGKVNENFQAKGYNIWFFGNKVDSIAKGEIFLDNIKVLY
jgi:hypothetical protein